MRANKEQLENLEAEYDEDKAAVIAKCKVERFDAECGGAFYKTCVVGATDEVDGAAVSFIDKYKTLNTDDEEQIRDGVGDQFDSHFTRGFTIKARDGISMEKVKEALGEEHYEVLCGLFDLSETLSFNKGFMEARATLRPTMSQKANEFLDSVVDYAQQKPSVKLKG